MISLMAPALVLLHGFTQTRQSWRRTVRALGAGRYRALVPDLPGHGQAVHRTASFDAVTAYVRALGPERFTLAGYSMGGRIALHAALALQPRVERLLPVGARPGVGAAAGGGGARAGGREPWAGRSRRARGPPRGRRRAGRPHRGDRRRGVLRGVGGPAAVRRPAAPRRRGRARRPAAHHRGGAGGRAARARDRPDGAAVGPAAGAGRPG